MDSISTSYQSAYEQRVDPVDKSCQVTRDSPKNMILEFGRLTSCQLKAQGPSRTCNESKEEEED